MHASPLLSRVVALLAAAGLSACAVGPDYVRPAAPSPAQYKEQDGWRPIAPQLAASDMAWWAIYGDPVLDGLERQVEVSNQSLKAAESNYRQALALVQESRAGYSPTLSLSAADQRSRAASGSPGNRASVGLDASWAPDLWGRVRRAVESSTAAAQASAADLAGARLSLQATLATDYFGLRVDDELARLYDEAVAGYQKTLEITRNQNAAGTANEADVITAETQLEGAQAQRVGVGVQRAQLEHAIAVLVGKTPDQLSIAARPLVRSVPAQPPGLPSTLLERRPDIAAAERGAAAASAQIGVAVAAYYPDVTLSASAGVAGAALGGLVKASNAVWALGPQLAMTLLDGGLRRAQVTAARASYDAAVANYRQTVLAAFAQVEDQLAALRILEGQAEIQQRALASARRAVEVTVNQYQAGTVAYTAVVTAQATVLADEQNLLTNLGSRLDASASLAAALGGGWQDGLLPTEAAVQQEAR
ncbi:efflux transporter outer membrane subunit [Ramlibacter humi]|uniref:Efflux transporter outer membrane subunit n=1 Tax=Ramlibacter humi TaxID=2530451 RepID=A0A4Z0BUU9_9BURK|nr:efflux transporter outer membrane subunit [Ramlibacter humi]TFZ01759.1 efflux transporter outer membrane subunit [Ramlibacter humi]